MYLDTSDGSPHTLQLHTESPPVDSTPAAKKRKPTQQDDSGARSEEEETQDATTQEAVASAALDLFTEDQEAEWDALITQALREDAPKATLYGDSEAVLSREQLRARRLQAITRLAQIYQVRARLRGCKAHTQHTVPQLEYWGLLEELRARANRTKPAPSSPPGRPTRASTYRPLRDIFEVKEAAPESLTATVQLLPLSQGRAQAAIVADAVRDGTAMVGILPPSSTTCQGKPEEQAAPTPPHADAEVRQEEVVLYDASVADQRGEGDEATACGRGLDVSLPTYEQVEQWLLSKEEAAASTGLPVRAETLLKWRAAFVQRLPTLLRLEQVCAGVTVVGVLCPDVHRYAVRIHVKHLALQAPPPLFFFLKPP